jgi:hypothetical protein
MSISRSIVHNIYVTFVLCFSLINPFVCVEINRVDPFNTIKIYTTVCNFTIFKNASSVFLFRSPSLFYLLVHSSCRGFLFSLDHKQAHTIFGRTPPDEGSARLTDLHLTTQTLTREKIHAPGGIRTHDPSKGSAADLRLRLHGRWDRLLP